MRLALILSAAAAGLALTACSQKTEDHAATAVDEAGAATASAADDTAANAQAAADKTGEAADTAARKADAAADAAARTN